MSTTQSHEKLSSAERVPLEIWHEILRFTLSTWLLPGVGDNVIDDILLFSAGCDSNMEYIRVESLRGRLREVCRLWKIIVDGLSIKFTISDFRSVTVPSESHLSCAKRLEFPASWRCTYKRCQYRFSNGMIRASSKFWGLCPMARDGRFVFNSNIKLERAQIVLLNLAKRDMVDYLLQAPSLRAFGGKLSLLWGRKELQTHSFLTRLTHLSIYDLSVKEMVIPLRLPRLRFLKLRLDLEGNQRVAETYVPLERWTLPKLTSLVVDGPVGRIHRDDLLQFFRNHSSTVENLVLEHQSLIEWSDSLSIDVHHLRQYPHLKVFGFSIAALDASSVYRFETDEDEDKPLGVSLLLVDINSLHHRSYDRLALNAQRCLSLCTPPMAVFDKVVMLHSWDQLIQEWNGEEGDLGNIPFLYGWAFFEKLYQTNIIFQDRNGVKMQEGSGLNFLERIRRFS
ncbi:hypothetical protein FRC18_011291 [Serendipita sp. 400]|nr:hypothetical protein FRC18_011291 [Serendipita sp. 400]